MYGTTVPTFNSCTKCLGHCTRPHARLQPSFLDMDARMTSQLNVGLIGELHGSLMCFDMFLWHVIHGCLYNQALADVRSTDAGIKCLYCKWPMCANVPSSTHSCIHRLHRVELNNVLVSTIAPFHGFLNLLPWLPNFKCQDHKNSFTIRIMKILLLHVALKRRRFDSWYHEDVRYVVLSNWQKMV